MITSGSTYIVKDGDSLASIAARVLGDVTFWQKIATLNGIRDPRSVVPGQPILLPTAPTR
jgi:nucleoid-associated protein YgaU